MPKKKILIIRRGLFGDSVVAINAIMYIRNMEKSDIQIHYLSDSHPKTNYLTASDVIGHLNLIDKFYNFRTFSEISGFVHNLNLFFLLLFRYNKLIILECNYSSTTVFIKRCRLLGFFLGINNIVYDHKTCSERDNSNIYIGTSLYNYIFQYYN
jgi:hypothetical protein